MFSLAKILCKFGFCRWGYAEAFNGDSRRHCPNCGVTQRRYSIDHFGLDAPPGLPDWDYEETVRPELVESQMRNRHVYELTCDTPSPIIARDSNKEFIVLAACARGRILIDTITMSKPLAGYPCVPEDPDNIRRVPVSAKEFLTDSYVKRPVIWVVRDDDFNQYFTRVRKSIPMFYTPTLEDQLNNVNSTVEADDALARIHKAFRYAPHVRYMGKAVTSLPFPHEIEHGEALQRLVGLLSQIHPIQYAELVSGQNCPQSRFVFKELGARYCREYTPLYDVGHLVEMLYVVFGSTSASTLPKPNLGVSEIMLHLLKSRVSAGQGQSLEQNYYAIHGIMSALEEAIRSLK